MNRLVRAEATAVFSRHAARRPRTTGALAAIVFTAATVALAGCSSDFLPTKNAAPATETETVYAAAEPSHKDAKSAATSEPSAAAEVTSAAESSSVPSPSLSQSGLPTGSTTVPDVDGQPPQYMGTSGLVSGVRLASGRLQTASVPACDGHGILIVESYIETPNPQQQLAQRLDAHPDAEFATPGACPSLRGRVDGARVYPIFYDFGFDTTALCQAKATLGGNARLLVNAPEFTDPC